LIYEYDFFNIKTFYIELLKTLQSNAKTEYPRCTYSSGEIPKSIMDLTQNAIKDPLNAEDLLEEEDTQDYYDAEDMKALNDDIEI
jgi:hypothetical protein